MTTLEKIQALVAEVQTLDPKDAGESHRGLLEFVQIARGFGIDPLAALLPDSEADADQLVDSLIALCLQVRGDDLPPFNLKRHVRDATGGREAAGA